MAHVGMIYSRDGDDEGGDPQGEGSEVTGELSWPLPCIKCGRKLEPVHADHVPRQPYAGTTFVSHGQYGSTVFEPNSPRVFLEINVCDTCMCECARDGSIARGVNVHRPDDVQYESWDPESDNS